MGPERRRAQAFTLPEAKHVAAVPNLSVKTKPFGKQDLLKPLLLNKIKLGFAPPILDTR